MFFLGEDYSKGVLGHAHTHLTPGHCCVDIWQVHLAALPVCVCVFLLLQPELTETPRSQYLVLHRCIETQEFLLGAPWPKRWAADGQLCERLFGCLIFSGMARKELADLHFSCG